MNRRFIEHFFENAFGARGGQRRDLRGQNVAQHSVALLETKEVARSGIEFGSELLPFYTASSIRSATRADRCARAVGEQTGADEHAGIVIHIKCGAANFDADGEDVLALR